MTDTPAGEQTPRASPPRYQPLVIVLAAAAAGILADRYWGLGLPLWCGIAAGALGLWGCLRRVKLESPAGLVVLVAVAAVAAGWHHGRWCLYVEDDLGFFAPAEQAAPVCLEAVAVSGIRRVPAPPPDPMRMIPRGDRTRLELDVRGIRDRADWQTASGSVVLEVDGHLLGVRAGDRVRVFAQLSQPPRASNPGESDYAARLRADRRCCLLRAEFPDCVSVVERAGDWNPRYWVQRVQARANATLWQHLDPQRAGLAATLLLGDWEELGSGGTQAYQETGTVHLLSVSGLHVAIVVMAVFGLARVVGLSRRWTAVATAATAVFYTLLTGAEAPAVRAAILVVILCVSIVWGRGRLTFNSLAAAALVVLAINPAELFRIGPQLSFLATAALMWFAPTWFGTHQEKDAIERLIEESRPWISRLSREAIRSARQVTLASAMIWLITEPLVMARFHLFTPIAVPLNTLLWLPIPVALWSGFVVLAFGWACPPLASLAARVCDGSLWLVDCGVHLAQDVPHGHEWVPGPANWWLVGFYGALGVWAAFPRVRPPRRWAVAILAGWAGIGLTAAAWPQQRTGLDCTFLAVGHGCAAVLELPSGQAILYDAGCLSSPQQAARPIAECLWSRGRTHLDAVVLSHADADHYNALPELLDRFSVGAVYVSPTMFFSENASLRALRESIERHGVPWRVVFAGDRLGDCPEGRVEVLHPPERGCLGSDNANSLVLVAEAGGRRLLLMGDLESPGLDAVLAEEPIDCDVLLVPHHGSGNSNPPGLATWCRPEFAVISGSLARDPAGTEAAYRRAGAEVLHTGRLGAVRARLGGEGVAVSSQRAEGQAEMPP